MNSAANFLGRQAGSALPLIQAMLNNVPQMIWLKDLGGRYLACNTPFETFMGLTEADLLGRTDHDFYPSAQALAFEALDLACQQRPDPLVNQVWANGARHPDRRLLEVTKVALRDAAGCAFASLGMARDITEHWQLMGFEQLRSRVLEMLAQDADLTRILTALAQGLHSLRPGQACLLSVLESQADQCTSLRACAWAGLGQTHVQTLQRLTPGGGRELCALVAATGRLIVVPDMRSRPHPDCDHRHAVDGGWVACWGLPLRDASDQVLGVLSVYSRTAAEPGAADLDLLGQLARLASLAIERRQDARKLQVAASVFSHALEGIMITTADARILEVNAAFTRITGYPRSEVLGQKPSILNSGRNAPAAYQQMWRSLTEQGAWSGELWNRRKDGEVYAQMLHISSVRDGCGQVQQYVALFSDVTERKMHEQRLSRLAHFDPLTGLPNRALHADRLHHAMLQAQRRRQKLALAYVDLDGFKAINDHYGHHAGDHLLIALAQRMRRSLREVDTLSRIGGDEFAAVLVDLETEDDCDPLLQRLLEAASQPVLYGRQTLQVSASVGVAFYPQEHTLSPDQLLGLADLAMYRAKQAGKNQFQVSEFPLRWGEDLM